MAHNIPARRDNRYRLVHSDREQQFQGEVHCPFGCHDIILEFVLVITGEEYSQAIQFHQLGKLDTQRPAGPVIGLSIEGHI